MILEIKAEYYDIAVQLDAIHPDLADECVDRENVTSKDETSISFWQSMIECCLDAANMRAAELGVELPTHLQI